MSKKVKTNKVSNVINNSDTTKNATVIANECANNIIKVSTNSDIEINTTIDFKAGYSELPQTTSTSARMPNAMAQCTSENNTICSIHTNLNVNTKALVRKQVVQVCTL